MTLKRGEFWSCSKCTLKNSLNVSTCKACKSEKNILEVIPRSKSPSPRHGRSKRQSKAGNTSNTSGVSDSSGASSSSKSLIKTVQQDVRIERGNQRINLRSDSDQSKLKLHLCSIQYYLIKAILFVYSFRFISRYLEPIQTLALPYLYFWKHQGLLYMRYVSEHAWRCY